MSRLTDNDHKFGPITWGKASWNPLRFEFHTGDNITPTNTLRVYALGYVAEIPLPTKVPPERTWVDTTKYNWSNNPDGGYWTVDDRVYGFSIHEGFLQIFHGRQTLDSSTDKTWSTHFPWTQWRTVRRSCYEPSGRHYYTEWWHERGYKYQNNWHSNWAAWSSCPTEDFVIEDYDGQLINVKTRVEEVVHKLGVGWFKWLSLFRKDRVYRKLDISFVSECGRDKGSYKGGLMGTSIELLPNETPLDAFRRYCEKSHYAKDGDYRIKLVSTTNSTTTDPQEG